VPKPQPSVVPRVRARSLYTDVLLAAFSLALSLIFAAANPAPTTVPLLPTTQPGISHDEGWFLITDADDGSQVIYFIAGNTRHSVQPADVQLELQLNPLWPMREATQDEVLAFEEGAPVGSARTGLLGAAAPAAEAPAPAPAPVAQDDAPAAVPSVYVLKRGDNLTHIAAQFGTSVDAILAANGLPNANRIYAGQSLVIPSADGGTSTVEAPAPDEVVADDTTPATVAEDSAPARAAETADAAPAPVADTDEPAPADADADAPTT
jgi:LysM repeat protein